MATESRGGKSGSDNGDNLYKRGDVWYVRFRYDGREIRRKGGRSKRAANAVLNQLRDDAERGALGLPRRNRKTLAAFAPDFLTWSESLKRSYERDKRTVNKRLVPALGHFRMNELTKARVEAYQRDRQKDVKGATVNREVACLRKLLNLAVERGELDENPIRGIRMLPESPARIPSLSREDEGRLLAACQPPWLADVVRLALLTGCRQGELLALRWRHVDFDGPALVVEDSKSGEARRIPLHPAAVALLKSRRGLPDGYLFTTRTKKPPTAQAVGMAFRNACKRAVAAAKKAEEPVPALDGFRFHDLRHIAGSRLLATGASLPEVAALLGHKTLDMARRYAHVDWNRLGSLIAKMPAAPCGVSADEEKRA